MKCPHCGSKKFVSFEKLSDHLETKHGDTTLKDRMTRIKAVWKRKEDQS